MAAAKLIKVYWRDIPAQVIAKRGRESARTMLSDRFQQAIDRAAMRAGKGGTDAYLEEWRRESESCGEDLQAAADAAAAEFEARYSDADLDALAKARGIDRADQQGEG
ncbi:MAG: virulence factor [Halofilum sp. (in: g-proteobacteria)]|nr:virulence factor [Halofilum sp. (in: g-proteobacteria)]